MDMDRVIGNKNVTNRNKDAHGAKFNLKLVCEIYAFFSEEVLRYHNFRNDYFKSSVILDHLSSKVEIWRNYIL